MSDNVTKDAYAAYAKKYKEASSDAGGDPEWPPAGLSRNIITGISIDAGREFVQNQPGAENLPATRIRFQYELDEMDPGRQDPLTWTGRGIILPLGDCIDRVHEKNQFRIDQDLDRLKTAMHHILGDQSPENPMEAAFAAQEAVSGDVAMTMMVDIRERPYKSGIIKTDFIREVAIGPEP